MRRVALFYIFAYVSLVSGLTEEILVLLSATTFNFLWYRMPGSFWETPVYTGEKMGVGEASNT